MKNEMWSHDNSHYEYRAGNRQGIEDSIKTLQELIQSLKGAAMINQSSWVEVARDWLEDELSMYEVGDLIESRIQ